MKYSRALIIIYNIWTFQIEKNNPRHWVFTGRIVTFLLYLILYNLSQLYLVVHTA